MVAVGLPPSPEQTIHRLRQISIEHKTKHHSDPERHVPPVAAVFTLSRARVIMAAYVIEGDIYMALRHFGGWAAFAGLSSVGFYTDSWVARAEPGAS